VIRFVIPAYNEAENIPRLLADLAPRARALGARVIVVDDGSTDGTADVVRAHADDMHLAVVKHPTNGGLGAAINTGIRAALSESFDGDAIVTLEADTTSDLDDLPRMLEVFERGHDVVLASVYAPGGRIVGVSQHRIAVSKMASNTFRVLGGLRELHTLSSLYRVYRAGTLRRAAQTYGYLLVREPGFAANVELLLKLYNAGASVAEVPTINDWTHRKGSSKMRLKPTALAYFRVMAAHMVGRIQPPPLSPLGEEIRPRALPAPAAGDRTVEALATATVEA
jgi:dolichol-phosphate mannosyltransferase